MTNPGIKYEYTIRKDGLDNDVEKLVYFWQYGRWTECSVTCGTGENRCSLYEPRQLQNKPWRQFKPAVCTHVPESSGFYKDGPGASMSSKCVRHGINKEAVFFFFKSALYTILVKRFVYIKSYKSFIYFPYLFIWLCQVFVSACGIFSCAVLTLSCSVWDLGP